VKDRKDHLIRRPVVSSFRLHPKAFVFLDRSTGTKRFEVNAGPDGSLPVEEAISLLAMQCVVRGQTPGDFRVMVSIAEDLLDGLGPRTSKLIEACMATVLPMHLSQRQQEVLRGITQNLSNKEIASKLNLAERTVKFHVSALLQKFHVQGRVSLMQKAGDLMSGERGAPQGAALPLKFPATAPRSPGIDGSALPPALVRLAAAERRVSR
jgi:DNA-binding CsgD family transcriptional regulator